MYEIANYIPMYARERACSLDYSEDARTRTKDGYCPLGAAIKEVIDKKFTPHFTNPSTWRYFFISYYDEDYSFREDIYSPKIKAPVPDDFVVALTLLGVDAEDESTGLFAAMASEFIIDWEYRRISDLYAALGVPHAKAS